MLKKRASILYGAVPILLAIFIIINGHKFVNRPKQFYSVNHDFREIALIDYAQIYDLIKKKGQLYDRNTALIETWTARIYWYVGLNYEPTYMFTWKGNVPYVMNSDNEKIVPRTNHLRVIENRNDLEKAMSLYPKGFILIDDVSLPRDVIEYAEKNLKKELYLDHYTLDDNPYSIWPATLYSWGIPKK
jgi:hypothetical protein